MYFDMSLALRLHDSYSVNALNTKSTASYLLYTGTLSVFSFTSFCEILQLAQRNSQAVCEQFCSNEIAPAPWPGHGYQKGEVFLSLKTLRNTALHHLSFFYFPVIVYSMHTFPRINAHAVCTPSRPSTDYSISCRRAVRYCKGYTLETFCGWNPVTTCIPEVQYPKHGTIISRHSPQDTIAMATLLTCDGLNIESISLCKRCVVCQAITVCLLSCPSVRVCHIFTLQTSLWCLWTGNVAYRVGYFSVGCSPQRPMLGFCIFLGVFYFIY